MINEQILHTTDLNIYDNTSKSTFTIYRSKQSSMADRLNMSYKSRPDFVSSAGSIQLISAVK